MNASIHFLLLLIVGSSTSAYRYRNVNPTTLPERRSPSLTSDTIGLSDCLELDNVLTQQTYNINNEEDSEVEFVMGRKTSITLNLMRGSFLRIASDLSGGTPLEVIKNRVTTTGDNALTTVKNVFEEGGLAAFWKGTPSRTVEGALMGAIFLAGSAAARNQVLRVRPHSRNLAALAGGLVGGVAQAFIMTPAGLVFTAVNSSEDEVSSAKIVSDIMEKRGPLGLFAGFNAMALRQATNWASRSTFTEIARTNLRMTQYGLIGEIGSGIIGGLGSTWNTPVETLRVFKQRDIAQGIERPYCEYIDEIMAEGGYPNLFRGVTPRAIQAVWQTVFMVVSYFPLHILGKIICLIRKSSLLHFCTGCTKRTWNLREIVLILSIIFLSLRSAYFYRRLPIVILQ